LKKRRGKCFAKSDYVIYGRVEKPVIPQEKVRESVEERAY
jgi:hypothetical protein